MTTTIYLDESGFTGEDLYNPDQRFFTIASTIVGEGEAREILARCFPRYQGDEYKFTNIWKRERSREGLRALAAEIPKFEDRAFVWIIDKRFCLLTKMVDYLVETRSIRSRLRLVCQWLGFAVSEHDSSRPGHTWS